MWKGSEKSVTTWLVKIAFCFQRNNIFEKNETFLNVRSVLFVFVFYIGIQYGNVKKPLMNFGIRQSQA